MSERTTLVTLLIVCIVLIFFGVVEGRGEKLYGFDIYYIKEKDTLSKIAPREHWDLIKKVNRIDEKHLRVGEKIFIIKDLEKAKNFCPVPPKPIHSGHSKILYFFLDIQYFAAYHSDKLFLWGPISSGKKGMESPVGHFKVLWKRKDYFSKKYQAPMPYAVNFSEKGYFFHQQSLPGKPASHGCIRLLKEDAEKLFYWVERNNPIVITRKKP